MPREQPELPVPQALPVQLVLLELQDQPVLPVLRVQLDQPDVVSQELQEQPVLLVPWEQLVPPV